MSEDKGSFLSRFFKRKQEAQSPPPQEQPIQATPPLPSSAEERKKILEERGQKQAQKGYENRVKDVQTGLSVQDTPEIDPEQIKKGSERVAMTQTLNQAADVQNKFAPKRTSGERFSKMTQSPPKADIPTPTFQPTASITETSPSQNSAQNPLQKETKSTLSEKRKQEINTTTLKKSLKTPPSEWGEKTKPATPEKPVKKKGESVAPFPTGTFPGVDKWQPGKGAIKGEILEKVIKEVKEMPKNLPDESVPAAKQNKPVPTPTIPVSASQEKIKEPA